MRVTQYTLIIFLFLLCSCSHPAPEPIEHQVKTWEKLTQENFSNLERLYASQLNANDLETAYSTFTSMLAIIQSNFSDSSLRVADAHRTGWSLSMKLKRYDSAAEHASKALRIYNHKKGVSNTRTIKLLQELHVAYIFDDRVDLAKDAIFDQVNLIENTYGKNSSRLLRPLDMLGSIYKKNGQFFNSEVAYKRAIEIRKTAGIKKKPNMASSKQNLAILYVILGRLTEAEQLLEEAKVDLEGFNRKRYPSNHASLMNNFGGLNQQKGEHQIAMNYFLDALALRQEPTDDLSYIKLSKTHINIAISAIEKKNLLIADQHLALAIENIMMVIQQEPKHYNLATILYYNAKSLKEGNDLENAIQVASKSLYYRYSTRDFRSHDIAINLNLIGQLLSLVDQSYSSILTTKSALNSRPPNEDFLEHNLDQFKFSYGRKASLWKRRLQEDLSSLSRYSEAELVGRISKLRDPSFRVNGFNADEVIPLTPLEREWEARLSVMHEPGPDGQEVILEEYTRRMDAWLEEVGSIPEDELRADWESFGTSLQDGVLDGLSALGDDVGMLQIASFEGETYFFVLTPKGRLQHHKMETGEDEIAKVISEARDQLGMHDPDRSSRDTLPGVFPVTRRVSKEAMQDTLLELHTLLMPDEVTAMLTKAGTKHLVLNLQGRIRYAPFGALYDGKTYLTQKYGLSRFTWGDLDYETRQGMLSNAAGFGMSDSARVGQQGFKALPGVETELKAIFAEDGTAVLSGGPKLNEAFTRKALVEAMAQQPSVLHISSHFDMRPGQDAGNSYLLLGDGTPLTLKEINAAPDISFEGVDLLVLSACSTARSTEGSGIEVEGLGAIAQLKGADAVMATLWNVADESTSKFMTQFYTELQKPGVDKAQAIRNTQEMFINGNTKSSDPDKDYSHPYYWAPYILMGNWK